VLRRSLTVVIAVGMLAAGGMTSRSTPAHASGICQFPWRTKHGYNTWQVKRTIKCAVAHFPVSGGQRKALHIAWRESRFDPHAATPNGRFKGIYQQGVAWWPSRYRAYGFPYLLDNILNARTNIIVSIRMAHRHGWGPWGG
jgi:hypothetical protein